MKLSVYDYIALSNTKKAALFLQKRGFKLSRNSKTVEDKITEMSDDLKAYAKKNGINSLIELVKELHPDRDLFNDIAKADAHFSAGTNSASNGMNLSNSPFDNKASEINKKSNYKSADAEQVTEQKKEPIKVNNQNTILMNVFIVSALTLIVLSLSPSQTKL